MPERPRAPELAGTLRPSGAANAIRVRRACPTTAVEDEGPPVALLVDHLHLRVIHAAAVHINLGESSVNLAEILG